MSYYSESQIDRDNKKWFNARNDINTLKSIVVSGASLRGLHPTSLKFEYPITAIVGANGSGKSTALALAACAFHNTSSFCPSSLAIHTGKSARNYYTTSDFFAFTQHEAGLTHDIKIIANYLAKDGVVSSIRNKKPSGKWRDNKARPSRAVSFLGLNRILPPAESTTHRNYRRLFSSSCLTSAQKTELAEYMTKVFNRQYSSIDLEIHKRYRLYRCSTPKLSYSGFNMGGGENAVLQLLYEIIAAGIGALLVVDEIELGLHVQAQEKLIEVLKELCKKYSTQIICSTHSSVILSKIPPCGRVMIHSSDCQSDVYYGVSEELAVSELAGHAIAAVDIFVEDDVAKAFLERNLPHSSRRQVSIKVMGSADGSLLHAVSTHIREGRTNYLAILDGDKRSQKTDKIKKITHDLSDYHGMSDEGLQTLIENHLYFIPGDEWPEKVIIERVRNQNSFDYLKQSWLIEKDGEIVSLLDKSLSEGKHKEFFRLAQDLSQDESSVQKDLMMQFHEAFPHEIDDIIKAINDIVSGVI